jgi:hypothetical protein
MFGTLHKAAMDRHQPSCPNCFREMARTYAIRDRDGRPDVRDNAFRCYYCNVYSAEAIEASASQSLQ